MSTPINPMLIQASDGPAPEPVRAAAKPYVSVWKRDREPEKRKAPTGVALAKAVAKAPPKPRTPADPEQTCPECGGLCVRRDERVRCLHCGNTRIVS